MLANFWMSPQLRQLYEVSFSYRATAAYSDGLHGRVKVDFPVYPLALPDPSSVDVYLRFLPRGIRRVLRGLLSLVLRWPFLLFDLIVLTRLFRRLKPDIIHINNGGYPGALSCRAAVVAARLSGVRKVLMVVNNLAFPYTNPGRWFDYPIDRLVLRSIKIFVTASAAAAERLRQVLVLPVPRVMSLPNGIRLRPLTETAIETRQRLGLNCFDGVLFGVVALMEKRKGHQILLDALAYLNQSHSPDLLKVRIWFEGDGPLRKELEACVSERHLGHIVHFVGEERNIFNLIQALDVLVLPSIENEDFPNVVLEAMALGKPVIASLIAGTREQVIDGVSGILVAPGDAVGLANALRAFLQDPAYCKELGEQGYERFKEDFTADRAVQRYLLLYEKMIETRV
jgi:glycosyltransferase involved in cell wall biosynthesis